MAGGKWDVLDKQHRKMLYYLTVHLSGSPHDTILHHLLSSAGLLFL
jgi:hypothetical protein